MVTYDLALDEKKRPCAVNVRQLTRIRPKFRAPSASTSSSIPLVIAALFVLFVIGETLAGALPRIIIATYGAVSILTFLVYRWDKSAAQQGRWRTKESSLLLLGLACGWPGAVVAQRALRHKSRKKSFQVAFWGTVVMNAVILGWLLTDKGSRVLDQLLR
jgi:uncharacterized membrane protein YsdA (DUF1294 family)